MEPRNSRLYQANNQESYNSLAAYVVTSVKANVMLYPAANAIVVGPGDDNDKTTASISELIDNEALDIQITEIEVDKYNYYDIINNGDLIDPHSLRKAYDMLSDDKNSQLDSINEAVEKLKDECNIIVKQLDDEKKEKERYRKYWHDATEYNSNLRKQLAAIGTLISSICPTR